MTDWSVINAPQTITTDAAGLQAAISSARPGAVVELTTAGAAINLALSGVVKAGYGVCVKLPMDQVIRCAFTAASSNIHFFGGRWEADTVAGNFDATNNGISVASGCSKISVQGALFDKNNNGIQVTEGSDIWIRNCRFDASRADQINLVTTSKVAVEDNQFDAGARGVKFCYFNDGRTPQEDISSSACTAAGGIWQDTNHNDVVQARTGCVDTIYTGNTTRSFLSQGFVTFGTAGPQPFTRALIANNSFIDAQSWGIYVAGTNMEIRDNTVAVSLEATVAPQIRADRDPGGATIRGGRNTAPIMTSPSGVDLASGSLNGDTVTAPTRPSIILPPWAPTFTTPAPVAADVPIYVAAGGILPDTGIVTGTWLSINRGQWKGTSGVTWEYRWKNNGVVIGGATSQIYQVQAGDVGDNITCEVRGTNGQGTGAWATYPAVVPA